MAIRRWFTSICPIVLMMFICGPAYSAQTKKPISPKSSWSNTVLWNGFSETNSAAFKVRINEKLPESHFKIIGKIRADVFLPHHVEITQASNGQLIQRLTAKKRFDNHGEGWSTKWDINLAELVQVVDLNADGYLDLRLLYNTGVTGNNWYASYIFDPASYKFKYHDQLSEMSDVRVYAAGKIMTYERSGWCSEYREYYKFVGSKLTLEKAEWTQMSRDMIKDEPICHKMTGMPLHENIRVNLEKVFDAYEPTSYLRKKFKIVSKELLHGSLDERSRGTLGNVIDP
jgi:hypothetical protein